MFEGVFPALITPFIVNNGVSEIDWSSFESLVEWQLASGVHGLVLYGTTGESPTLTFEEKVLLTKKAKAIVGDKIPIIVGAGTNATQSSITFIKEISSIGIDAVLAVVPYYNKPSQEGIFQHFSRLALEGKKPLILYNVPSRTGVEMSIKTIERLSVVPNVVAIKQATDSIENMTELCNRVSDKLSILSGDDLTTMYAMLLGAKGVVSATASVLPKEMLEVVDACRQGKVDKAKAAQFKLLPKVKALFRETNPVPAKYALKVMGRIESASVRLPLVEASEETKKIIDNLFS